MKKREITLIALVCALLLSVGAAAAVFSLPAAAESNVTVRVLSDEDGILSEEYLAAYSCTADGGSAITDYTANGGSYSGHGAANALDGNFSTFWETNTPNSQNFTNHFTVTFDKETQIERIVYATRQDGYKKRGYPRTLTVYTSSDETGETFAEAGAAVSSETGSKVLFTLPEPKGEDGMRFVGWKIGDKLYAAGDAVTANAHLNAVAVYEPLPPETGGDNEDGENGNGSEGNGGDSGNEENNGTADDPLPVWPFVAGGVFIAAAALLTFLLVKGRKK